MTLQPATGYQGRIGRYGPELAAAFLAAAGVREGQRALWGRAGLRDIATGELNAGAGYSSFDDLWEPLVATDGSPGAYYATLKATQREALRQKRVGGSDRRLARFASRRAPGTYGGRV